MIDDTAIDVLVEDIGSEDAVMVLDIYLEDAPEQLARLCEGIAAGDETAVAGAAHRLKSTSAMVGATRLAEVAEEVEVKARARQIDGLAPVAAEIELLLTDTFQQLGAVRARLGGC